MENLILYFYTHTWSKTFAKYYYYFFMKLEQVAKVSNQTMDAVHSHDLP